MHVAEAFFSRFSPSEKCKPSQELKVAVVGGGPAGLLLAWKLLDAGHEVTIYEKREEHQLNGPVDRRSYNLTADGLGLRAFGRLSNLIYFGGTVVDGRAIHLPSGDIWTHPYGRRASDVLVSIPRGELLALLAATIVGHKKCKLRFKCEVTRANTRNGKITFRNKGAEETFGQFDLVAFSDGVKGIGHDRARRYGANTRTETHETPYLTATISKEAAIRTGLTLDKIHFFPCDDSLGIGLPNYDGTISLLIEGRMHENPKGKYICPFTGRVPFNFNRKVFTDRGEAEKYLEGQNPKLAHVLRDSVDKIVNKRPERFIQSFVSDWRIEKLGIVLGDAGSCAPPWAGFGMNLACSHAEDLARLVSQSGDLDTALDEYNHRRIESTNVVQRIVKAHGELLNSGMGLRKWQRDQTLRDRREQVLGERSDYQTVAFEEGGLEILAGLE